MRWRSLHFSKKIGNCTIGELQVRILYFGGSFGLSAMPSHMPWFCRCSALPTIALSTMSPRVPQVVHPKMAEGILMDCACIPYKRVTQVMLYSQLRKVKLEHQWPSTRISYPAAKKILREHYFLSSVKRWISSKRGYGVCLVNLLGLYFPIHLGAKKSYRLQIHPCLEANAPGENQVWWDDLVLLIQKTLWNEVVPLTEQHSFVSVILRGRSFQSCVGVVELSSRTLRGRLFNRPFLVAEIDFKTSVSKNDTSIFFDEVASEFESETRPWLPILSSSPDADLYPQGHYR